MAGRATLAQEFLAPRLAPMSASFLFLIYCTANKTLKSPRQNSTESIYRNNSILRKPPLGTDPQTPKFPKSLRKKGAAMDSCVDEHVPLGSIQWPMNCAVGQAGAFPGLPSE
eukprot:6460853-Amphidinium_carterae.1